MASSRTLREGGFVNGMPEVTCDEGCFVCEGKKYQKNYVVRAGTVRLHIGHESIHLLRHFYFYLQAQFAARSEYPFSSHLMIGRVE